MCDFPNYYGFDDYEEYDNTPCVINIIKKPKKKAYRKNLDGTPRPKGRPTKKKPTEVELMWAQTKEDFERRGDKLIRPNAKEVRYTANYLVARSPLRPYFKAMGITKGSQIGRAFVYRGGLHFFKSVYWLYCLYTNSPENTRSMFGMEEDEDMGVLFRDRVFKFTIQRIAKEYFNFRRSVRNNINRLELKETVGKEVVIDLNTETYKAIKDMVIEGLPFNAFHKKYGRGSCDVASYATAVLLLGDHNGSTSRKYIDDNQEAFVDMLTSSGAYIAMLRLAKTTMLSAGIYTEEEVNQRFEQVIGLTFDDCEGIIDEHIAQQKARLDMALTWDYYPTPPEQLYYMQHFFRVRCMMRRMNTNDPELAARRLLKLPRAA